MRLFCLVIHLVEYRNQLLSFREMLHLCQLFCRWLLVNDPQNDGCFIHFLISTFDTQLFNLVGCASYSGCVNEAEGDAMDLGCVFNDVTSGTVDIRDDGFLFMKQAVEQG